MALHPRSLSRPAPAVCVEVPGFAYFTQIPREPSLGTLAVSPAQEALDQLFGYFALS